MSATPGSRPCCRVSAGSRGARRAIRPKSRSSRPTSTRCSSSAASITISIRAGSSATWSSRGRAAPRRSIVLNKADLVDDPQVHVDEVAPSRRRSTSTRSRHDSRSRSHRCAAYLTAGRTGALLGSSGVGKSTIVNSLVGHELLRTHEVRESDSRGRHTSTHRQLVPLPGGGLLIDTPGMRELQLWDDGRHGPRRSPTSRPGGACRFRDCRHRDEPGCAVTAAVGAGRAAGEPPGELPQAGGRARPRRAPAGRARAARAQAPGSDRRQGGAAASPGQGPDLSGQKLAPRAARGSGSECASGSRAVTRGSDAGRVCGPADLAPPAGLPPPFAGTALSPAATARKSYPR